MQFQTLIPKKLDPNDLSIAMQQKIKESVPLWKLYAREDNFKYLIEFEKFCLVVVESRYYHEGKKEVVVVSNSSFHFLGKDRGRIIYSFYCKDVEMPFEEFSCRKRRDNFIIFRIRSRSRIWNIYTPNIFFIFCKNLTESDRLVLKDILPDNRNKESRVILVK